MPIWALVLISVAGFAVIIAGFAVFVLSFVRSFFTSFFGAIKKVLDGNMDVN